MFHRLESSNFTEHINFHKGAISMLVVPVMTLELVSSVWLAWTAPSHLIYHQAGFVLVALIWLITFFVQVPLHSQLLHGRSEKAINRLVKTNWFRTILWSIKAMMSIIVLYHLLQ
jgi:hypothetical protein